MRHDAPAQAWLLLIHQLPAKPAYLRVKIWRRLQALGAVGLKGSVYALPNTDEAQEDLQWLLKEIVEGGGEGFVTEARLLGGLADLDVEALFQTARSEDYRLLNAELEAMPVADAVSDGADGQAAVARARRRFEQIASIDFFKAPGRETAERQLSRLEARVGGKAADREALAPLEPLLGRTWVTRQGVHVDRIACAWLIRRFIDPAARFKFVPPKGYRPEPGALRFDMFDAEFTHEGDRCSFEVLLARRRLDDAALTAIGEIIHDLDVKDGKFGRPETVGIGRMLDAIAAAHHSDEARIARGSAMLDDLHVLFGAGEPKV